MSIFRSGRWYRLRRPNRRIRVFYGNRWRTVKINGQGLLLRYGRKGYLMRFTRGLISIYRRGHWKRIRIRRRKVSRRRRRLRRRRRRRRRVRRRRRRIRRTRRRKRRQRRRRRVRRRRTRRRRRLRRITKRLRRGKTRRRKTRRSRKLYSVLRIYIKGWRKAYRIGGRLRVRYHRRTKVIR